MAVYTPPQIKSKGKLPKKGFSFKSFADSLDGKVQAASDDAIEQARLDGTILLSDYVSYWQNAAGRTDNTPLQTQNIQQKITAAQVDQFEAQLDEGITAGKYTLDNRLSYLIAKRDSMVQGSEAWYEAQSDINSLTDTINNKNRAAYEKEINEAKKQVKKNIDEAEKQLAELDRDYEAFKITGNEYDNAWMYLQEVREEAYSTVVENSEYFTVDEVARASEKLYEIGQYHSGFANRVNNPGSYVDVYDWGNETIGNQTIPMIKRRRTPISFIIAKTIPFLTSGEVGWDSAAPMNEMLKSYLAGEGASILPNEVYIKTPGGDFVKMTLNKDIQEQVRRAGKLEGINASDAVKLALESGWSLYQTTQSDGTTLDYFYSEGKQDLWRGTFAGQEVYFTGKPATVEEYAINPGVITPGVSESAGGLGASRTVGGRVKSVLGEIGKFVQKNPLLTGVAVTTGAPIAGRAVGAAYNFGKNVLKNVAPEVLKRITSMEKLFAKRIPEVLKIIKAAGMKSLTSPVGTATGLAAVILEGYGDIATLKKVADILNKTYGGEADTNELERQFNEVMENAPNTFGTTLMKVLKTTPSEINQYFRDLKESRDESILAGRAKEAEARLPEKSLVKAEAPQVITPVSQTQLKVKEQTPVTPVSFAKVKQATPEQMKTVTKPMDLSISKTGQLASKGVQVIPEKPKKQENLTWKRIKGWLGF